MRRPMNELRPDVSDAVSASGSSRKMKRARSALRFSSPSQSAMKDAKSTWRSLASTGAASRKCTSMNSPSLSAIRCWLLWMIAVCGIGSPKGRRNSATTAYQSARPPMVAASAKAATKPNAGCRCSKAFAVTNSAKVPASTRVASALMRRNSAARSASPEVSDENVPVIMAFGPVQALLPSCPASRAHYTTQHGRCLKCDRLFCRTLPRISSNLDLRTKFHHLSRGHAEEGCGAFGVVLQKCEKRLAPDRHAHHPVARDDRLAADIISDGFRVDPANFSLIAGGAQSFCDRNFLFHEAEVKDDACVPSITSITCTRPASVMRGVSSMETVSRIIRWCIT